MEIPRPMEGTMKEILKEISIKDKLHKIYIQGNRIKDSNEHKNWKKQRNKVNCLVKAAKD